MIQNNFDIRQKISSFIALTFIILLGLILGWYSIKTSEELLINMPDSKIINMGRRSGDASFLENEKMKNSPRENKATDEEM